ncbi:MAG: tRNA uridine-5-carboxymethylaminomethyl(34) synthesis GTPase MnmE [Paracoccaceae bacterium]
MPERDTIYALASARGRAGVSVIRVSGPRAFAAGRKLAGDLPPARHTRLALLADPDSGEKLDQSLVITFAENASFTAESTVEFHTHGSPAVITSVLRALSRIPGLRLAEPGEFTRRALEAGNLDLAQVEGLADLLEAETEAQRRQAFRIMRGAVADLAERWRSDLVRAQALVAATIDFADEDVPEDVSGEVQALLGGVMESVRDEIRRGRRGERVRDGFEVALVGRPNSGKSTLLNCIAGRDVALTSEIEGTTRDVIELRLDLRGIPVTLLDTAGLHDPANRLDALGVERAKQRANDSDLRVFLLQPQDKVDDLLVDAKYEDLVVNGKCDLNGLRSGLSVSGKTGEGVGTLLDRIADILARRVEGNAVMIRERHRQCLAAALADLESAANHVCSGPDLADLAAEDLRRATRSLDSLLGRVDTEDILDEVFKSFCLGK